MPPSLATPAAGTQPSSSRRSFVIVTSLFFLWGFITCLNDLLIPKFKADFDLTQFEANLVQSAFFGACFLVSLAYFVISAAFGDPINRIGYKNGISLGLAVSGLGCLIFYPAAGLHAYPLFLGALLVLGGGITLIQIAANYIAFELGRSQPGRKAILAFILIGAVAAARASENASPASNTAVSPITAAGFPKARVIPPSVTAPRIPDGRFNVRDHGAKGDGKTNDSASIQAAIEACHNAGGGTVVFPPGRYPAASVRVRSRVRLELDKDAEIFGASDHAFDLPIERPGDGYQDMGMSYPELAILWGDGVEDFSIIGGKINAGSITRHDPEPGEGNKVIAFINSKRLRFEGVTHEYGGHFVYNLNGCEDITLKDVVIGVPRGETAVLPDGNMQLRSRDGISLVSCRRVLVAGCHFTGCGDDTIGIKNHYALNRTGHCEDILVEDSVLETGCNALQIGSETAGDFRNIHFRNVTIRRAMKAALSVTSNDGARVENVTFENITVTGAASPIFIAVTDRLRSGDPAMARVGSIRGVRFSNITIRDGGGGWHGNPQPLTLVGHPDSWIEDVTFENLQVVLPGGTPSADDGRGYVPAYTKRFSPDRLGLRPASVLYAREVRGLTLSDVEFSLEKPDPRPPVVGQDWERVTFERVRFSGTTAKDSLVLDNAQAVTITDSPPLPNLRDASAPARETPFVWQPPDAKAEPPVADQSFDLVTSEPRFAIRMLWIKPGSFQMGSPDSEPRRESDEGQHEVTLLQGFWLSAHEITQRQWFAIMGTNPSRFATDPELPVHNVSWKDAMEFCRRLTLRERAAGRLAADQSFTLPTEAQWEFACRAGTATPYAAEPLDAHAWYDLNLVQRPIGAAPMQIGLKKPNAWGVHDMHGNVWEWCFNDYDDGSAPARKVIRGGSWRTGPFSLRSANRASLQPEAATHDTGFRISLTTNQETK